MQKRQLGKSGVEVSSLGLGAMGMSEFYGPTDDAQSLATLERAYELGVTFYDTSDQYGIGHNETLLSGFLKKHRDAVIATKFGIVREPNGKRRLDNSPDYVRSACDASLKRLGVDVIDLYYVHRVDVNHPIEETVEAMAGLVKAGKVKALGLSEASAATLRRAHAVHPISALQTEYSLWTRDVEKDILPACRELGVTFVPYSPLGRGILTGAITKTTDLAANDFRRISPRFQGENFDANLGLVEKLRALAAEKQCTLAQLALAWLLYQGNDIVPIPGTKRIKYLEENAGAADVKLTAADLERLAKALPPEAAVGARYPEFLQAGLNA
jgi:aryl-alcohol dehydrogenase-like predicted oxidoreductase